MGNTEVQVDQIQGSPLSDKLILAHMDLGNIVIEPFIEANLQSSSYDLRLGEYYFEEQDPTHNPRLFNPYKKAHIDRVWGRPQIAKPAKEYMDNCWFSLEDWEGIEPEDRIILLQPGKTYLCHTEEFIGFRNVGTTEMKARSTLGRDHIEVCKCAGWGDNGYINRWTMEVTNNSAHYSIPLVIGTRVAQLIFYYTGGTDRPYESKGNYQKTGELKDLRADWEATSMLPAVLKKS